MMGVAYVRDAARTARGRGKPCAALAAVCPHELPAQALTANGGTTALGATGAMLIATLRDETSDRVTPGIGGGMGVATIVESLR